MPRTIRFHLDENVNSAIATGLRGRGVDVTTTREAGLIAADDEEQLKFAKSEGRVVVTHDDDFLRVQIDPYWDCILWARQTRHWRNHPVAYLDVGSS